LKTLFIGSTLFGIKCLEAIKGISDVEVVGILTAPQHFSISYAPDGVKNVIHTDFSDIANELNCPLLNLNGKMSDLSLLGEVETLKPDNIIVAGWHHMIPQSWLRRWPTYGLHASMLPAYSGGAPLVWAIINGERWTGVSFFRFNDGVDAGPVVGQQRIRIERRDDIQSLYQKVTEASVQLIESELPRILNGTARLSTQDESKRTLYRQRNPEDGSLVHVLTRRQTRDFVRAQTSPYPGAFIEFGTFRLMIWELGNSRPAFSRRPDQTKCQLRKQKLFIRTRRTWVEALRFSVVVIGEETPKVLVGEDAVNLLRMSLAK
jgi:methionyl-tRNA formyltransferase